MGAVRGHEDPGKENVQRVSDDDQLGGDRPGDVKVEDVLFDAFILRVGADR
jgi:hypothetical protein